MTFSGSTSDVEHKIKLATERFGLFSAELFQAMICGGEPFNPTSVAILWDRLIASGLATRFSVHPHRRMQVDHILHTVPLLAHLKDGTFQNLFASPSRLPERYSSAMVAIDVKKDGDLGRGTGFVVKEEGRHYLITCRHNVDKNEGIEIKSITTASGNSLEVERLELSGEHDIAIAPINKQISEPAFALTEDVEIFDQVYTLGYPLIPRAGSVLVGHRGEINAKAHLYRERCDVLLISNLVSPGSSGGPVLASSGRCIGMTINWLEGETLAFENEEVKLGKSEKLQKEMPPGKRQGPKVERMKFSAALPAATIREFLRSAS
ncbi:MAG: serine protease [Erythrobacter sp.]|nr:serine protease [Erythrobacter sp.]